HFILFDEIRRYIPSRCLAGVLPIFAMLIGSIAILPFTSSLFGLLILIHALYSRRICSCAALAAPCIALLCFCISVSVSAKESVFRSSAFLAVLAALVAAPVAICIWHPW